MATLTLENLVKEGQRLIAKDPKNKNLPVFVSEEGSDAQQAGEIRLVTNAKQSLELFWDDHKDKGFEVHILIY